MEIIWVLENVKQEDSFYNKLRILLLIASTSLWKKYHPTHTLVLYCDNLTLDTLSTLGIFHLWNDIRPLNSTINIRKSDFWSTCKTEIISKTKIPICIVDHDFLIFKNIEEHLKDNVLFTHDEKASNWYPKPNCKFTQKIDYKFDRIDDTAANVSLLYLPNPKFSRKYAKQVIINHKQFSELNDKSCATNHMILSEQLMLKQWLLKDNIKYKTLSKNVFDCKTLKWTDIINNKGIWNIEESLLYYKHYGVAEKRLVDDINTHNYLLRCINAGKIIDAKELNKKLNDKSRFWS
tara:strand:- start:1310 stop:2185 length:876 start_codon:yes stop_codon:yes gene_type:complete